MPYRTLLVHADATDEGRTRVAAAAALAKALSARLIGIGAYGYALPDPERPLHDQMMKWVEDDLMEAERAFREAAAETPDVEWRRVMAQPGHALADAACGADLVIASRASSVTIPERFARPDELLLEAAAPVMFLPSGGGRPDASRVVVAWKDSREARRAVSDALPFLLAADEVRLVRVVRDDEHDDTLDAVAARLSRLGAKVEPEVRRAIHEPAWETLVAAAADGRAGLMVAGGYGHSRIRERVLGGVTQGLLNHSPFPLLLSH